jgi:SAM-dependent methyltransferase
MDFQSVWNERYRHSDRVPEPATVLREYAHLLPARGRALDVACGLGSNGIFLARAGLETWAWDLSNVAIAALDARARDLGIVLRTEVRDVVANPPAAGSFDVVVVSHFLERRLAPGLQAALRPGGLLYYQTFTKARVDDTGPRNPDFRLGDNELLGLFRGLKIRSYREEGRTGDISRGFRNEAMLVGERV